MSVGALEDKFYAAFTELLGLSAAEAVRADPADWPALA